MLPRQPWLTQKHLSSAGAWQQDGICLHAGCGLCGETALAPSHDGAAHDTGVQRAQCCGVWQGHEGYLILHANPEAPVHADTIAACPLCGLCMLPSKGLEGQRIDRLEGLGSFVSWPVSVRSPRRETLIRAENFSVHCAAARNGKICRCATLYTPVRSTAARVTFTPTERHQ